MCLQMTRRHARVAVCFRVTGKSLVLFFSRASHPFPNRGLIVSPAFARDIAILDRRHFDVKIDSVEEGTGNSLTVPLNLNRTASAFAFEIAEISARTGIHCRDEHELARKS